MRTRDEIYGQVDKAVESMQEHGSQWPAMTYEDGVEAALRWVTGDSDERPMDDD